MKVKRKRLEALLALLCPVNNLAMTSLTKKELLFLLEHEALHVYMRRALQNEAEANDWVYAKDETYDDNLSDEDRDNFFDPALRQKLN